MWTSRESRESRDGQMLEDGGSFRNALLLRGHMTGHLVGLEMQISAKMKSKIHLMTALMTGKPKRRQRHDISKS